MEVGKFFCGNEACQRRIFTERLPEVAAPWARKTVRQLKHLQAIGLALGGEAGSQLGKLLGYPSSGSTLLKQVKRIPLPEFKTPRILGVEDFAFRKGQNYGTILVDLEINRPIALLADRSAETLAKWLAEHPGIEILSRDRSKTYKRGMNEGAAKAIQVADRFHLMKNLEEALEKALKGHTSLLKQVELQQLQAEGVLEAQQLESFASASQNLTPQLQKAAKRAERLERYEQVHALRQQGFKIKDIAHHLGMGKRTVYTYLSHPTFPEWQPNPRKGCSSLDPYKCYLINQWHQGYQQTKQLYKAIQQQGFDGSYRIVARFTRQLRISLPRLTPVPEMLNQLPGRGPAPVVKSSISKPLSPRRAAWLVLQRPETLKDEQKQLLERLIQQSELSEALRLTQDFIEIVRQRLPNALDAWLERAKHGTIKAFQCFAKGIEEDYDAVRAGVTLEVSNGSVEGFNNRLKMLKRQMFGRAGLDLLAKRLILTSS